VGYMLGVLAAGTIALQWIRGGFFVCGGQLRWVVCLHCQKLCTGLAGLVAGAETWYHAACSAKLELALVPSWQSGCVTCAWQTL
jgi:hypothetical protein